MFCLKSAPTSTTRLNSAEATPTWFHTVPIVGRNPDVAGHDPNLASTVPKSVQAVLRIGRSRSSFGRTWGSSSWPPRRIQPQRSQTHQSLQDVRAPKRAKIHDEGTRSLNSTATRGGCLGSRCGLIPGGTRRKIESVPKSSETWASARRYASPQGLAKEKANTTSTIVSGPFCCGPAGMFDLLSAKPRPPGQVPNRPGAKRRPEFREAGQTLNVSGVKHRPRAKPTQCQLPSSLQRWPGTNLDLLLRKSSWKGVIPAHSFGQILPFSLAVSKPILWELLANLRCSSMSGDVLCSRASLCRIRPHLAQRPKRNLRCSSYILGTAELASRRLSRDEPNRVVGLVVVAAFCMPCRDQFRRACCATQLQL